jgi:hypothetical protein
LAASEAVAHDGSVRNERREDPMLMTTIDTIDAGASQLGSALAGIVCAG